MAKGRKRKSGPREKNGRASRRGQSRIDKGTERAQEKFNLYHGNGTDPIGRAYERGLLGTGTIAKQLLDIARSINFAYWAAYQTGPIRCTLADRSHGGGEGNPEADKRREAWLGHMLAIADRYKARNTFDGLVIDIHPDAGPVWLDRLLARSGDAKDRACLNLAIDVLRECAGIMEMAEAA